MNTATQTRPGTLNKAEIRAIRRADRVILRHHNDAELNGETTTGELLLLDKDGKHAGRIPCESKVTDYDLNTTNTTRKYKAAYSDSADVFNPMGSAMRDLKNGDRIELHWVANNNNDYLKGTNLTTHEVRLIVNRQKGHRRNLRIGYQVTSRANWGQMVMKA